MEKKDIKDQIPRSPLNKDNGTEKSVFFNIS